MPELDFSGLRGDIEAATQLPEFTAVARRGLRARTRDRIAKLTIGLVTLCVLVPAGLAGLQAAPGPGRNPLGPDAVEPYLPVDKNTSPPTVSTTVYAVAGLSRASMYAAIDVCRLTRTGSLCSLQVVSISITAQDQRIPIATGLLRENLSDTLDNVDLVILSPKTLLLSASRRDGQPVSRRITISNNAMPNEPVVSAGPQFGDRLVQTSRYGDPSYARQSDEQILRIPVPPALTMPVAVTSAPVESGWWLTGTDPTTGELAVAVSHDQGTTWLVRTFGLTSSLSEPVVATRNGTTAYVFIRTAAGIHERRTNDGGQSWEELNPTMPWPTMPRFDPVMHDLGAIVRPDGSLLIWLEDDPGTVCLESTDGGATFRSADGPGGPIIAVGDGYVTITDPPRASLDARNWTTLAQPPTVAPSST